MSKQTIPGVDSLLISIDHSDGIDHTVLVVGRKTPGEVVQIVNAFQGEEALELYRKLTEKRTTRE